MACWAHLDRVLWDGSIEKSLFAVITSRITHLYATLNSFYHTAVIYITVNSAVDLIVPDPPWCLDLGLCKVLVVHSTSSAAPWRFLKGVLTLPES